MRLSREAIFVAVFLGSAALTWLVQWMAGARRLLDLPNARSAHSTPRPRLGGVAIMGAFLVGAALVIRLPGDRGRFGLVIACIALVSLLGLVDDLRPVPARWRLVAQAALATALILLAGGDLRELPGLLGALPIALSVPLAIVWIVWLTNLYNFMDGIDGLAAGQAVLAGLALTLVSISSGAFVTAGLCLILSSACAGFLLFNFPPASIFMGDAGSTAIGFTFAALPFLPERTPIPAEAVALALSLFILDATMTLLRRAWRGENLLEAHRTHCYQRPLALGFSHRHITLLAYLGMSLAAASAWLYIHTGTVGRLAALLLCTTVFGGAVAGIGCLERRGRLGTTPSPSRD